MRGSRGRARAAASLEGARCLITGASAGIGRALALRLAAAGARVCLHGRDADALAAVADAAGGAPWVASDLAEPDGVRHVATSALDALGGIDVLVNNAGIGWAGPFASMTDDEIARLVAVDLTAPMLLTRALVPSMVEQHRGHVVFVGSIAGHVGVPNEAAYAAVKAGLVGLADSLRAELGRAGIAVSLVSPGPVVTEFFARRGVPYERRFPRPVPPERVADAIVRCIRTGRAEVFVPRWLSVPARLRGVAPATYRRAAAWGMDVGTDRRGLS
ncbi:MAG TPA: SDR family NAD(P)-dependent oxidoreductase [Acidimicrobiales bacterium]